MQGHLDLEYSSPKRIPNPETGTALSLQSALTKGQGVASFKEESLQTSCVEVSPVCVNETYK